MLEIGRMLSNLYFRIEDGEKSLHLVEIDASILSAVLNRLTWENEGSGLNTVRELIADHLKHTSDGTSVLDLSVLTAEEFTWLARDFHDSGLALPDLCLLVRRD